jgi:hypothetical protein
MIIRNYTSFSKLVLTTANRRQLTVHSRQHIFLPFKRDILSLLVLNAYT